ncbi:MAG TPA: glutamine-hydrolyzing GMP synthase [Bryobacterales bacterium]|nr:glutamine-hydrolyzing GMP synthase [Bryobacterales bacterium]
MEKIVVLDAGGQYCHLIARKVRELGVYAEIRPLATRASRLKGYRGAIISGSPASVLEKDSPRPDPALFRLKIPILGICYGQQLMAQYLQGEVKPGAGPGGNGAAVSGAAEGEISVPLVREFGEAEMQVKSKHSLFAGLKDRERIWMSHGDSVSRLPRGFRVIGSTRDCEIAAMADEKRRLFGIQFHPEVTHTTHGQQVLTNFLLRICGCQGNWHPSDHVREVKAAIRRQAGQRRVLFFLSGGVDSTVAYTLAVRALGPERVHAIFVDTGFMRLGETEEIATAFEQLHLGRLEVIDAGQRFFQALRGVIDPEEKRRIIGRLFVEIQDGVVAKRRYRRGDWMLGQGTIYPDTIESGGTKNAARIKTHHNRVDRIQQMIAEKRVLEPLAKFYKDEVRRLGHAVGLPDSVIRRHPFPGPGLAIRCLCSERQLRVEPDAGITALVEEAGYQAFLLPLHSVGVQGDSRTYGKLTVLHGCGVHHDVLAQLTTRITNRFPRTNRVAVAVRPPRLDPEEWRIKRAALTPQRIRLLQKADHIVTRFLHEHFLYDLIWQCPVVLLPFSRDGGETVALRPISSVDGMTAEVVHIPVLQLHELAAELAELDGVDAVLFDISNKPPSTIEWE